jgi:hypothetical protein
VSAARDAPRWIDRHRPYSVRPMDAREFNVILADLEWSRRDLRSVYGVSERVASEYSAGRLPVPTALAEALRVAYRGERPPEGWTVPGWRSFGDDDGR